MEKKYKQLGLTERIEIYRLHAGGKSLRFIAKTLKRDAGTISRELRRNSLPSKQWDGGYDPQRAEALTERRRARGCAHKLERQPELRKLVLDHLAMGRSPEQIAGRLTLEHHKAIISPESIYRYLYWRVHNFKEYLHQLLPRKKYRRGWRGRRGGSSKNYISRRVSVHQRPAAVHNRSRFGHWEADLMLFSKHGQAALVVHERKSRYTVVLNQPTRQAQPVADNIGAVLKNFPESKRKSMTFDNGPEFSRHFDLTDRQGIKTYFCDTHSPWQKGGVENAIGRLRRRLPRKTDISSLNPEDFMDITRTYNDTPRKCLGFLTPSEVFFKKKTSGVALQT
jgi:IS30 family transposase